VQDQAEHFAVLRSRGTEPKPLPDPRDAIAFLPSAEVRQLLDQAASEGRDVSEVINELLGAPPTDAASARSAGRPSSYRPEFADQARKLCRLGATDEQLADFFGISDRTMKRWEADHPEFCQGLNEDHAA
jgi:hypothetical protein